MSKGRLLYIEDNFENRALIRRVLQAEGYAVTEADDGQTGLEIARKDVPDLILMDINLPDMTGYECTTRMRQLNGISQIPIVALSGNVFEAEVRLALDAGCDGYIHKPVDTQALPGILHKYLNNVTGRYFLWIYALVVALVEAAYFLSPILFVILYLFLLQGLAIYIALNWRYRAHRKLLALALVPIARILDYGLPTTGFTALSRGTIEVVGTAVVCVLLMLTLKFKPPDIFVGKKNLLLQLPIALTGILFGVSFSLLAPFSKDASLISGAPWVQAMSVLLVLLLGLLDAIIFQGILLNVAGKMFSSRFYAPFYVATLYTVLFLHLGSLPYLALIYGASLLYSYVVMASGSLIGTGLGYSIANLMIFIIIPSGILPFLR